MELPLISFLQSVYTNICLPILLVRGDKQEDQNRADVADEEAERSKHFDEEAGTGNPSHKTAAGSSRAGESSSKSDFASTSILEKEDNRSRNSGKDIQRRWFFDF